MSKSLYLECGSGISGDMTVPLLIWEFYNDPNLVDLIWGCSLLLLILTLVLNIIAKRIAAKWKI